MKGVVIICHGRSNDNAIRNAIRVACESATEHVNDRIASEIVRSRPRMGLLPPREPVRKIRLFTLFLTCFCAVFAQKTSPAHWTLTPTQQRVAPGSQVLLELKLELGPGVAHVCADPLLSPGRPEGQLQRTIGVAESPWAAPQHLYFPAPAKKYDPNFQIDTETTRNPRRSI